MIEVGDYFFASALFLMFVAMCFRAKWQLKVEETVKRYQQDEKEYGSDVDKYRISQIPKRTVSQLVAEMIRTGDTRSELEIRLDILRNHKDKLKEKTRYTHKIIGICADGEKVEDVLARLLREGDDYKIDYFKSVFDQRK